MTTFIENVNKLAGDLPDGTTLMILLDGKADKAVVDALVISNDNKVDKISGKGLSTHDLTDILYNKLYALDPTAFESKAQKGVANGYAPLNSNNKIDANFIDSLNLYTVFTPADEASMLALPANPGDVAYREDTGFSYMLIALPATTLANWKQLNITLVSWASIQGKPSTLAGFGITDAYTQTEVLNLFTALVNDVTTSTTTVYSSAKTQALHDAQALAIANLASASGSIASSTMPVFAPIPLIATNMPFSVTTPSTNSALFSFNDGADTITFSRNGNFNFLSNISIEALNNTNRTITFKLINTADNSVISSTVVTIDMSQAGVSNFPLNTLLTVGSNGIPSAPLTIKIQAMIDSGTDINLKSFSSILASGSSSVDTGTIVTKDSSTGSAAMPTGTTAQRTASPSVGFERWNTDLGKKEVWNGSFWVNVGGGATGGGTDNVFWENDTVVTTNYSITANKNAGVFGPLTINNGVSITIPVNSTLKIL